VNPVGFIYETMSLVEEKLYSIYCTLCKRYLPYSTTGTFLSPGF